jgi:SprT protein
MKNKVKNRVLDLLIMVSREFEIPEIKFDLKGACAGICYMKGNKCTLQFNLKLLEENQKDFLRFIVPHEVAHYVTASLFGKVAPHGKEWRTVMHLFGIEHPSRCHSFSLKNIYPWIYKCQCREYDISQKRHSLIINGKRTYSCRDCGDSLEFVGKNT